MQPESQALTFTVLGIPVSRMGFEEAIDHFSDRLREKKGGAVYFANVHTVTESTGNEALARTMRDATCLADGMPVVWASRFSTTPIRSRVCGPDFMLAFIERHPTMLHAFVGGKLGQAERLAEKFKVKAVTDCPPVREFSKDHVQEDLKHLQSKLGSEPFPGIVWVGLGAPKQELWIAEAKKLFPSTLFFGVGAAFDFLTGDQVRAPLILQKTGLEWLFRLCREPRRLWKRYLKTNTLFLLKLIFTRGNGK